MSDLEEQLPYPEITPIPDNRPPAIPALWNFRFTQVDANLAALWARSSKAIQYDTPDGSAVMPSGPTSSRGLPDRAKLRLNTDTGRWEGANGSAWGSLGGATGGGSDAVFYENDGVINSDYTVTANTHAVGPLEVSEGVTLTIEGRLVIL